MRSYGREIAGHTRRGFARIKGIGSNIRNKANGAKRFASEVQQDRNDVATRKRVDKIRGKYFPALSDLRKALTEADPDVAKHTWLYDVIKNEDPSSPNFGKFAIH